ncbi:MAG: thioredoxin family protein [Bacteroidaceae bacterium]|nr:thioredoxin family protein [Bacteroidaceae bacterium]
MKKRTLSALFALLVLTTATAQTALPKVYDETIDQNEQIDNALKQAKREGKFVVCQVGGNWCPWCLRFADFISKDNDISTLIRDNFVYIHVNYSPNSPSDAKGQARTAKMMKRLGNPGRFGFPVFVVLDERGNVVHTQDSSFLEEGQGYDKDKVLRFFKNWTPKIVHSL